MQLLLEPPGDMDPPEVPPYSRDPGLTGWRHHRARLTFVALGGRLDVAAARRSLAKRDQLVGAHLAVRLPVALVSHQHHGDYGLLPLVL